MSCDYTAQAVDEANLSFVGVGLRHQHYREALLGTSSIDFVEIHAENFFSEGNSDRCCQTLSH